MIIDWLKENKVDKEYDEQIDAATKRFLNQRNAIREIYDTKGYKEIIRWLTTEKEQAMSAVMASGKDRVEEKARYHSVGRLLTFLENVANAK